jgi:hypothetical protein
LADSLALRRFVGIALDEYTPDHSTISRTRRKIHEWRQRPSRVGELAQWNTREHA